MSTYYFIQIRISLKCKISPYNNIYVCVCCENLQKLSYQFSWNLAPMSFADTSDFIKWADNVHRTI